jgi:Kef-type K+ transport system membrane component KefB
VIIEAGIIDDIISLLLLSGVIAISSGYLIEAKIFSTFFLIFFYFITAVMVGYWLIPKILSIAGRTKVKEGQFSVVVGLILLYGLGAEAVGLSGIIGAFLAGLFVRHSAELGVVGGRGMLDQFSALALGLLTPLFFVWLGLIFSLQAFIEYFWLILLFITLASIGKVVGGTLGSRAGGFSWLEGLAVGTGMNARGSITLVVAEIARRAGVISTGLFSVILIVALITTLATPPLLKCSIKAATRRPWSKR